MTDMMEDYKGPWFCVCNSSHYGYIFDVCSANLLGRYSPQGEYYFAAFTRSLDAANYVNALNDKKVAL